MNRGGITGVELVVAGVVLALLLSVCVLFLQKGNAEKLRSQAGYLVWESLIEERPEGGNGIGGYQSGWVRDGVGVALIGNEALFWVKDGTVYTVNEAARSLLPQHPQAPPEITSREVRALYDGKDSRRSR